MTERTGTQKHAGARRLLTIAIAHESGIVTARQRARTLARLLGFQQQDQIRIATATSEITRNALQYARGGRVEFSLQPEIPQPLFLIQVIDQGPGIADIQAILDGRYRSSTGMGVGISGTARLMDSFSIESTPGKGTAVTFGKFLPLDAAPIDLQRIASITDQLAAEAPWNAVEELRQQNQELMVALDALRRREVELRQRQLEAEGLNQELEETNRGVVALYAELDERASALRSSDEIKTRFLSYMGHEFRTPLNSILALTDLLMRGVDGDLTPEQDKQIGFVRSAAKELFEMVNDLLDIAKVEAGKVEVCSSPVNVGRLFGAIRGMMRPLTNPDGASLIFEDPPGGLSFATDEGKLSQILRNLISNALKFTDAGEIRVSARQESADIVFRVSDTGMGIAPQDQERIFREFTQIDNPVQRKVKGTGLGLPLSRKLAEVLGGTLVVESQLGSGSTFRLTLPTLRDEQQLKASLKPAEAAEDKGVPGSILVIDDEKVTRYLMRQAFRGTRHTIAEASGGTDGLKRARSDQPKLILLDLSMPDRDGFEVLDELKKDPATKAIPVVIHTSRVLSPEDLKRLGGKYAAVLPKHAGGREQALRVIRLLLGEPHLFPTD